MIHNIRSLQITDINYLLDIDLKCFDDPWDVEKWREIYNDVDYNKLVGTNLGNPVGFVVWQCLKELVVINRIAVKPKYRKQGIGGQFLKAVRINALQQGSKKIAIDLPESLCYDNQEVSHWLNSHGFFAIGTRKNGNTYCGKIEDSILFILSLGIKEC